MTTFPTRLDLEFYKSKQVLPSWARGLNHFERPTAARHDLIDDVIASHAGTRLTKGEMASLNLIGIIRLYRRRENDLASKLRLISSDPGCAINPEKRAAFARKWANRMKVG